MGHSKSPPVVKEKGKPTYTPIPAAYDGEAEEISSRRQRILYHALRELGPLSAHEREQLTQSNGQRHSTPLAASLDSKFVCVVCVYCLLLLFILGSVCPMSSVDSSTFTTPRLPASAAAGQSMSSGNSTGIKLFLVLYDFQGFS